MIRGRAPIAPLSVLLLAFGLQGCVIMHHAQFGDIDQRKGHLRPFDIKVSETGFSLDEARQVAGALASKADRGNVDRVGEILSWFQMGPHTGNGVFNDKYAQDLVKLLYDKCPSGRVTGLVAVRETNKYPVISGEIVHIMGYCQGKG